jgi:hypothetical protein
VQGRDDNVGGFFLAQLEDDLGQIGLEGADAGSFKEGIQLNLGRGHGLDLDDLSGVFLAQQIEDDLAGLGGIRGPVNRTTGCRAAGLKEFEIGAQVFQGVHANGGGCRAQILPVGLFCYQTGALGLDDVDGVSHVLAQLRIAQDGKDGFREWRREPGVQHGVI